MDSKQLGLWAMFAGLVLGLVAAFVDLGAWVSIVLIVIAIIVGYFHATIRENLTAAGVIYLVLVATSASMAALPAIGPIITNIVNAWVGFLGPVMLTAFMVWGGAWLVAGRNN
jgi:hypothetical protein